MADDVTRHMFSTFAGVAAALGFSEIHGMIIGVLVTADKPLPLQEIARRIGYSLSSISISIDFLEVVGIVRKSKTYGDRKVYVKLEGDLLESVRKAFLLKIQKEILLTKAALEKDKGGADAQGRRAISVLEKEVARLQRYIDALAKVEIPK